MSLGYAQKMGGTGEEIRMKPLKVCIWYITFGFILLLLYYYNVLPRSVVISFRVAKYEMNPIPKTGVYLFGDCLAYTLPRPFTPRFSIPGLPARFYVDQVERIPCDNPSSVRCHVFIICGGVEVISEEPNEQLYNSLERVRGAMSRRFPNASITVIDPAFILSLPADLKLKGDRYHLNREGLQFLKEYIDNVNKVELSFHHFADGKQLRSKASSTRDNSNSP
jgi:hypothetical protein